MDLNLLKMDTNNPHFGNYLSQNFSKYLAFCKTLDHLDGLKLNFTPLKTASHFLNFWRAKFENS